MALSTSSNFAKPDDAFRAIVEAHRGLTEAQSADLDAALVLVLANHIGDLDVLCEAIALAKRRMPDASQQQQQQQAAAAQQLAQQVRRLKRIRGRQAGLPPGYLCTSLALRGRWRNSLRRGNLGRHRVLLWIHIGPRVCVGA